MVFVQTGGRRWIRGGKFSKVSRGGAKVGAVCNVQVQCGCSVQCAGAVWVLFPSVTPCTVQCRVM